MEEFVKAEIKKGPNQYFKYKLFLNDLENITTICNEKCLSDYQNQYLNNSEVLCLEKCYYKTMEMNQYMSNEIFTHFNKYQ
jgi:hypothetical protein